MDITRKTLIRLLTEDEHVTTTARFQIRTLVHAIYRELFQLYKTKISTEKSLIFFLFLLQNIDCGNSLESPRRGGSNHLAEAVLTSTHNLCFGAKNRYTPANPTFSI